MPGKCSILELPETGHVRAVVHKSAIRRVINLRVKSAGSFWKEEKAQTMIFLRAKLLYGRWHHLVHSWKRDLKDEFSAILAEINPSAQHATLKKAAA